MSDTPKPATRPKNSFEFVTVASARAKQLLQGCVPKVEGSPKLARRAVQEVSTGAVARTDDAADD
jgi:DNA-directed RNA polymerase subunit K/omega